MVGNEQRAAPRLSRKLRFRFDADGVEWRSVATNVSLGGAFLKASYVPRRGTLVTLREVADRGVRLRGTVVWATPTPTLTTPETGFAIQFVDAYCLAEPEHLVSFLRVLVPGVSPQIQREERSGRVIFIHRFPPPSPVATPQRRPPRPTPAPREKSRPAVAGPGLPRRVGGGRLDQYAESRSAPGIAGTERAPLARAAGQPGIPVGGARGRSAAPRASAPGLSRAAQPGMPSGGRRSFGGLLSLFGFSREEERRDPPEPGFSFTEESSFSPTFEEAVDDDYFEDEDDWYVGDDELVDVLLDWKDGQSEGRIETVSGTMIAIAIRGEPPMHYERVVVVPEFPTFNAPEVHMLGTVTRVKEGPLQGEQTVIVRFTKIEEARQGAFQEYIGRYRR